MNSTLQPSETDGPPLVVMGATGGLPASSSSTGRTPMPPLPTTDWLRRQQALVAMGHRAAGPPERSILIEDAAGLLAEVLDAPYSSVAEISPDGASLTVSLTGIKDDGPARPLVCQIGVKGEDSLSGYVLQVAHPVAVADLTKENRFRDSFLGKHGIRSALAAPLKLHDQAFGSLAACDTAVRNFDDADILFVETIAHLVATTIGRKQAEGSLADQGRLTAGVLQSIDALVLVLDGQGQILSANAACQRVAGFSSDEIRNRPLSSVFAIPEQIGVFQDALERLQRGAGDVKFETFLLTKHSQRRQIIWTCNLLPANLGATPGIVATGIDVTEQREAEERARRAEQEADAARRTVTALQGSTDREITTAAMSAAGQAPPFHPLPIPPQGERRKRQRRAYPYVQLIGPVINGRLPEPGEFHEVSCHDIAAGGFSYISSTPPNYDTLVVALGIAPRVSHLLAQVAHITRIEENGQPLFLVGCSYVRRAVY